jgi:hypothetical protein
MVALKGYETKSFLKSSLGKCLMVSRMDSFILLFWNKLPLSKYGFTYCSNLFFVMVWSEVQRNRICFGLFIWCMGANSQIPIFKRQEINLVFK